MRLFQAHSELPAFSCMQRQYWVFRILVGGKQYVLRHMGIRGEDAFHIKSETQAAFMLPRHLCHHAD